MSARRTMVLVQGWKLHEGSLEATAFRALMQLLVGVEQGHSDVAAYAAAARKAITANCPETFAIPATDLEQMK